VHVVVIRRAETLVDRAVVVIVVDDLDFLSQAVDVTTNLERDLVGESGQEPLA
jgi:hypothetical protein